MAKKVAFSHRCSEHRGYRWTRLALDPPPFVARLGTRLHSNRRCRSSAHGLAPPSTVQKSGWTFPHFSCACPEPVLAIMVVSFLNIGIVVVCSQHNTKATVFLISAHLDECFLCRFHPRDGIATFVVADTDRIHR